MKFEYHLAMLFTLVDPMVARLQRCYDADGKPRAITLGWDIPPLQAGLFMALVYNRAIAARLRRAHIRNPRAEGTKYIKRMYQK